MPCLPTPEVKGQILRLVELPVHAVLAVHQSHQQQQKTVQRACRFLESIYGYYNYNIMYFPIFFSYLGVHEKGSFSYICTEDRDR